MDSIVYRRPWMYPKQSKAIFDPNRYSIIEGTTKSGKTVGCMIWITEQAMKGNFNQNFWWVSPIFAQAKIVFRRLKAGLPKQIYTANESELKITLCNGTVIWFKGADKPDSLYGEDVFAAVMDEASRIKEESWYAVRSTLTATKGKVRIIGNVKGRANWAYRLARKAESGAKGMSYHKITAYDAADGGVIDRAEIEKARNELPENIFKELYEAEPADDGGNPFREKYIRACVKPLSTHPPVAFGIDLAKSVDFTVIIGIDNFGDVCFFDRFKAPWNVTKNRIIQVVGDIPALVDSTGVGDPVVEDLQKEGSNYEGFKFSSTSKQQIMVGLQVGIEKELIGFPEGEITSELSTFEYEYTQTGVRYTAPTGLHDDCVCSLALAWHKAQHNTIGLLEFYKQQYEKQQQQGSVNHGR